MKIATKLHVLSALLLAQAVGACSSGDNNTDPSRCNALTCPTGTCIADRCVVGDTSPDADADATTDVPVDVDVPDTDITVFDTIDAPDVEVDVPVLGTLGEPCLRNDQCESNICTDSDIGLICTERCVETCSLPGYACVARPGESGNVCEPVPEFLCKACTANNECGVGGFCTTQANGDFCAPPCNAGSSCDEGYICDNTSVTLADGTVALRELCVPETGLCNPLRGRGGLNALSTTMRSARFTLTGRITYPPRVMTGGVYTLISGQ